MGRYFPTPDQPTRPEPRADLAAIPATLADVEELRRRLASRDRVIDQLVRRVGDIERREILRARKGEA